jgi:hypothetical protein
MAKISKKQQIMNMQAQLEHLGLRLEQFSRLNFNATQMDDLGSEFVNVLSDIDAQQNCNRYVWKGLPEYLTSHLIETMLYNRGSLVGFFTGGTLYVLPYTMCQGLNVYGQPNAIQPISYNGELTSTNKAFGKELLVSHLGRRNENAKACILFDRIPAFNTSAPPLARRLLNATLIEYQADLLGRIKNNLRNVDKKVVFWVDSEAQKNQTTKDLIEAYGTSYPFIVAVKGTVLDNSKNNSDTLQGNIANETQSLFEAWQSINSIRCMCSGITNGGAFEKKERKITGELQGDQTQTQLVLDAGLKMRQLWLDQMRSVFPEEKDILSKITVELNENSKVEETGEFEANFDELEGFDNE